MYQGISHKPYFCGSNIWEMNIEYMFRLKGKDGWQDKHT